MPGVTGSSPVSSTTSGEKTRRVSNPFGFRCSRAQRSDGSPRRSAKLASVSLIRSAPICRASRIVRAGHQSFKRVKDPVWIHADVMGQLLIPLRRAENGQGSSNRQRIGGHTLIEKNLGAIGQDNVVPVPFQQDADDGAGHDRLVYQSKLLADAKSVLYGAQRSKCLPLSVDWRENLSCRDKAPESMRLTRGARQLGAVARDA